MAFDALSFFAGAAEKQMEHWSDEDQRREKFEEQMRELHAKGVESRRKEWVKKGQAYNQMKSHMDAGDMVAAYSVYTTMNEGLTAKQVSEAMGEDMRIKNNPEALQAMMNEAYSSWSRQKEPTFDVKASPKEREIFYQGSRNDWEHYIRNKYGVSAEEEGIVGTPYAGVKRGSVFERKPDADAKFKTRFEVIEMNDGTKQIARIDYTPDGEKVKLVMPKRSGESVRSIPDDSQTIIMNNLQQRLASLEESGLPESTIEAIEGLKGQEGQPIETAIMDETMRLMQDGTMRPSDAFNEAWNTFTKAVGAGGAETVEGAWYQFGTGDETRLKDKVLMVTPNGRRVLVPLNQVGEFLEKGGAFANDNER